MARTEQKIAKLREEIKALKQAVKLSYGAMQLQADIPTVSYEGTISLPEEASFLDTLAKWEATFTRNDGLDMVPFADFCFDYTISPDPKEYFEEQYSATITCNDYSNYTRGIICSVSEVGTGYIKFGVTATGNLIYGPSSCTINFTIQALSPVYGTLTLERIV